MLVALTQHSAGPKLRNPSLYGPLPLQRGPPTNPTFRVDKSQESPARRSSSTPGMRILPTQHSSGSEVTDPSRSLFSYCEKAISPTQHSSVSKARISGLPALSSTVATTQSHQVIVHLGPRRGASGVLLPVKGAAAPPPAPFHLHNARCQVILGPHHLHFPRHFRRQVLHHTLGPRHGTT
jgi:hypothetical protein